MYSVFDRKSSWLAQQLHLYQPVDLFNDLGEARHKAERKWDSTKVVDDSLLIERSSFPPILKLGSKILFGLLLGAAVLITTSIRNKVQLNCDQNVFTIWSCHWHSYGTSVFIRNPSKIPLFRNGSQDSLIYRYSKALYQ